jgi:hypothetical protein
LPRNRERPRAPHVQAAFTRAAQPQMAGAVAGGRPTPAHVQRAVTGALQPRAAIQAAGMSLQRGTVIQGSFSPYGLQQQIAQRHGNSEAFQLPAKLSSFGCAGGEPLPLPVLQRMESFFATSFADVRVHVGAQAASIGALAFAQGSNLYFAPGQYNPGTAQGLRLLGHELAHVVQQRSGRVRNPFGAGVAVVQNRAMEAEADQLGMRAAVHRGPVQAKVNPFHPAPSRFPIQRAKGLAVGTHVEVREGNSSWYGCITAASDDSYRIEVGGTDRVTTVPENRVTLHPVMIAMAAQRARRKVIAELHNEYFIFDGIDALATDAVSGDLTGQNHLVYKKIDEYLEENNVQALTDLRLHDGAKKTLVARGARDVLKLYAPHNEGIYLNEKKCYEQLARTGVDMRFFVAQWGWDPGSLTARAENLASNKAPGGEDERTAAMRQVLTHLKGKGLFLNDLDKNDNIGTSLTGAAVVFDVKSLVTYDRRKYEIP